MPFAFGDDDWPGLAKLSEESGEVIQEIGKLMMTHGDPVHWSGNLRERLLDEISDLRAASTFVLQHCFTPEERLAGQQRKATKYAKFLDWHNNPLADPPPATEGDGK